MTGTIPAMHLIRSAIAGILALVAGLSPVIAQQFPTVPDRTVIGRIGVGGQSGPSQAIPFANLLANIATAQPINTVWAGPASGAAANPTFRLLVGADLPNPGASSKGGVQSLTCAANQWLNQISTAGVPVCAQPAVSNLSGFGTGVATALGINVGTAGSPVVNGGALGTPSSGVGTNLTGTASGLTAGNVTTNANLTGPVTSVGNATTIGTNQVSRANEAQGIARSVIGVTGNAGANVADIQGTADQALVVNSAGTALAFGKVNLTAGAGATGTLPVANGGTGDTGTAWTAFTPTVTCGTATFTTQSARSKTMGKTTWVQLEATMTALGTCTNLITFTLPNTAQSAGALAGRDSGFSGKNEACGVAAASATASCALADFTNWTNASKVVVSGVYENQ